MKKQGFVIGIRPAAVLALLLMVGSLYPVLPGIAARATQEPPPTAVSVPDATGTLAAHVVAQDSFGIELEFTSPAYTLLREQDAQGDCDTPIIEGYGMLGRSGAPALPATGIFVGVPAEAALTLRVLSIEQVLLPEVYNLCPAATPIAGSPLAPFPENLGVEQVRDAAAYSAPGFFPAASVEIVSSGYIRSQRVVEIRYAPFQYDPQTGQLRHAQRIRVRLEFGGERYRAQASAPENSREIESVMSEDAFDAILRNTLVNYESARAWRVARETPADAGKTVQSVPEPQFRIVTREAGMYKLTYEALLAAAPDLAWDSVDPRNFHIRNQGREIAIRVIGEVDGSFDPGDWILFYGEKITSKYTLDNMYWLTWDEFSGMRMSPILGVPGSGTTPTFFGTTRHMEVDYMYLTNFPSGNDDRWYDSKYIQWPTSKIQQYTTVLQNVNNAPISATIQGLFRGFAANPSHQVKVFLNSHQIYSNTWSTGAAHSFAVNVPSSYVIEGTNTIKIERHGVPAPTADTYFTNWFEIDYFKGYAAQSDSLFFDGDTAGTWKYRVNGFTTAVVEAYDITDPLLPSRIIDGQITYEGGSYVLTFEQSIDAEHHYLALAPTQYLAPKRVENDRLSSWRSPDHGADYIILSHRDFITAVQPLAQNYVDLGLRVETVDVQDVYDEFGAGWVDPEAIRAFLAYAYAYWELPAPLYVLLVGDGNYDFKDNRGSGERNYVPPYLAAVDPWMGETAADNRYVAVSGDDIFPDLHLGRLPVKTAAEITAMVNKILAYAADTSVSDWQQRVLFVADDPDSGGNFHAISNAVADYYVPAPYTTQKIYYGISPYTTGSGTRTAIVSAINAGQLVVNYVGHAAVRYWASEQLMNTSAVGQLTNTGRLPFMIPMTCLEGYYLNLSSPTSDASSFAETIVRKANGGAIASWSPTGQGLANGHDLMNKALYRAIFFEDVITLGPATTLGKLALVGMGHPELIDTYLLFGDPATRLNVLPADVAITKTVAPTATLLPGDWLTYTLSFTNNGPARANNVVIEDLFPSMLLSPTVSSSGAGIARRPNTLYIWDVVDLAPGTGGIITITAQVSVDFAGTFTNTATIHTTARELPTAAANNTSAPIVTQVVAPDVEILKTGPHTAMPGETIRYVLEYGNVGTAAAAGVVITDLLHSELLTPVVTSSGPAITPRSGTTFVWDVDDLPPGAQGRITITAVVSPSFFGGALSNQATISTATPEIQKANNTSALVATGVLVPDLVIEKFGPAAVLPGVSITYVVTYVNLGNGIASGVVITDLLPAGVENVTVLSAGAIITPRIGSAFVWDVADLPPNASGMITLTGTVAPTFRGTLLNQAFITTESPEMLPENNASTPVQTLVSIADVTITKTGPAEVLAGERITYTLSYTNTDNGVATGVVITDTLSTGLMEVTVTSSRPGVTARPGTAFVWDAPDLAPGASGVLTITATVNPATRGVLLNQAVIAASVEASTANNTSPLITTEVMVPDVRIEKQGPAQVQAGETLTYVLTFDNAGTGLARDVVITDLLPAQLSGATFTASGAAVTRRAGTTFVWDVVDLAPGAGGVLTITATVDAAFSGDLTNTAGIATSSVDSDPSNNVAEAVTAVPASDVRIAKQGPAQVQAGETLTYVLTFDNAGTGLARDVVITDLLPAQLSGATFTASGAAVTRRAGTTFAWDVVDLAPGAGGVITITATVDAAFSGDLTNTAGIATSSVDGDLSNNVAQAVAVVQRAERKIYLPLVMRQQP